jgi:hypothetical protein
LANAFGSPNFTDPIYFDLAKRLGLGEHFFDGNIDAAWNHQLGPSGLTVQQLRAYPIGAQVEARTRYQKYAELDRKTGQPRGFHTPTPGFVPRSIQSSSHWEGSGT